MNKMIKIMVIAETILLSAGHAHADIRKDVTIRPKAPIASATWTNLPPLETAHLRVTVVFNEDGYCIKSGPTLDPSSSELWTGSMSGNQGDFYVVNESAYERSPRVDITCVWEPCGGGGGGGPGPRPPDIDGHAYGIAHLKLPKAQWNIDSSLQEADGSSTINWTVGLVNDFGDPLGMAISYNISTWQPWDIEPDQSPEPPTSSFLSGTTKAPVWSRGFMRAYYSYLGRNFYTDSPELTFVAIDKMQYSTDGPWADIPPVIYIPAGSNINFKTLPLPSDSAWPTNRPTWTGAYAGIDGTASNTFTEPGTNYVSAKCGNTVTATVVVLRVDLDIDADNNDGFNLPGRTEYERSIKDDPDLPGKYIRVNRNDFNTNGVPAFADGFDKWGNSGADAGGRFVPMILEISEPLEMDNAKVIFTYSASDPDGVTRQGSGTPDDPHIYAPAAGHLRIWKVDGTQDRNKAEVDQPGGHFVNTGIEYAVTNLGAGRTITLYVEGISASANPGDQRIVAEVDPDGDGPVGYICSSAVRLTVIDIDLDIDSDNNNAFDPPDRSDKEEALEIYPGHPGKALAVNHLDRNKNGVPDFADGYDIDFGEGSQSAADASHDFVPVILEFSEAVDVNKATVVFRCEYLSNPANVTRTGDGTDENNYFHYYVTDGGHVRLWLNKNGSDARQKALVPTGDAILKDEVIKLSDLSPAPNRTVQLYLEALEGSVELGDIKIKVELDPDGAGEPAEFIATDQIKATVFDVESVRPIKSDFASKHEGKIMISAMHGGGYHTTGITTRNGTAAQTEDAKVVISAYIQPIPPSYYTNLTVYFEVTDPDDLSHYEGKTVPGTPDVPGDMNPNDNRDPNKQMRSGTGQNYTDYQNECLTANGRSAQVEAPVDIAGQTRAVAETILRFTDRYSGDNYYVRATMRKPHNLEPFDTVTSWTTNQPYVASTIQQTETLIAWKRVYIEQDNMYTLGATITADASSGATNLTVDSSADFSINDPVVIFWKGGSFSTSIAATNGATLTIADGLPQGGVPRFGGVRPAVEPPTYEVDRRYLARAFGSAPDGQCPVGDGSGAGAFIEFMDAPTGSGNVPKYAVFIDWTDLLSFSIYWFNNYNHKSINVLYLLAAKEETGVDGWAVPSESVCVVYSGGMICDIERDETVVHEIGHRFYLVAGKGGRFSYIDTYDNVFNHASTDMCIMSYSNNWHNAVAEFSLSAIVYGSSDNANDSLRDSIDR